MIKENNPYIDKEYIPYKDKRWNEVPAVKVLKINAKLTKEQKEKADSFTKFIDEKIEKEKDTK